MARGHVRITAELLVQMLTEGNKIHGTILEGLPEDAELISVETAGRDVILVVESESLQLGRSHSIGDPINCVIGTD